jgi:hypothetical protein
MLCYKDTTFCGYWQDCRNSDICHRPLTKKIKENSIEFGLPICQYSEKPDCWEQKKEVKDDDYK